MLLPVRYRYWYRRTIKLHTYRLAQTGKGPPAFRGAALNVGPVKYRGHHTFVVVTTPHDKTVPNVKYPPMTWGLVGVPFYRFAGICKRDYFLPLLRKRLRIRPLTWQLLRLDAPANAEFTTSSFVIGEGTESGLWLNAKASWTSDTGGTREPGDSCESVALYMIDLVYIALVLQQLFAALRKSLK
eukprot:COSAG04_NODE_1354_length_7114_cov_2.593443_1_plen_185_part_00